MAKRKLGKEIQRNGRIHGDKGITIAVASDLLKVEGIPIRDAEVSYYSREFPIESFSVSESASSSWAETERESVSPETSLLYKQYQTEILPWVERINNIGRRVPDVAGSAKDVTESVREKARTLGYGEVGFTRFDRRYIYSNRRDQVRTDLPNAICLAIEQDYVRTQDIPGLDAEKAQGDAYLLDLGYRAQISGPAWHFGPVIPMFVQSGLGQLGVNGQLLSPHFGSRARLQIVITDAPLRHDTPVDYGIYKLCETCQICFMRCPGKAIQAQRVWFRGVEKHKLIARRCRPVMTRFSGCGICIKVCPVQKYGMTSVMDHYLETIGLFYDEKVKFISNKDKYINCNGCPDIKEFKELYIPRATLNIWMEERLILLIKKIKENKSNFDIKFLLCYASCDRAKTLGLGVDALLNT